jgi:hypothetical protein
MADERRLNWWETEALCAWLKHYITMEQRHELMRSMPTVYNKIIGREVATVQIRDVVLRVQNGIDSVEADERRAGA